MKTLKRSILTMNFWNSEWDYNDDFVSSQTHMKKCEKYDGCFYTYINIETLRKRFQKKSRATSGKYFPDSCTILIDRCSREDIESVIYHRS
jgi:hypothetical protein